MDGMIRRKARARKSPTPSPAALTALRDGIARWTKDEGVLVTGVPGLRLVRRDAPSEPASAMYEPCVCVCVQGSKRVLLGGESFHYEPGNYLISSVHLPTVGQVTKASAAKPFLALVLTLDPREVSQLMLDGGLPPPRARPAGRGMATAPMSEPLMSAFGRLVGLLDSPQDIPILGPALRREIAYRLLVGEQGARLRQVALIGSRGHQVAQALDWLKTKFAEPVRVEDLAERAHMSPSSFHQHFRAMTAMSPLQYQKWLRLSEARRLMLAEDLNAGDAAFRVGYESSTQFSREYRRLFELPPRRDIERLKREALPVEA